MAVLEANARNFNEIIQGDYVVVDVYGPGCGACVMLAPIFERCSVQMPLTTFAHMNLAEDAETEKLCADMGIMSMPTLLFYRSGKLVHRVTGAMGEAALKGHLAKLLYE